MASESIDISFIILTWNSAAYVEECLDSIVHSLQPEGYQYEVIVVDNGSDDQTVKILQDYRQKYPKIFKPVFLLNNMGTTLPRNIGLKQACGRFLCIMDSDVVLAAGLFPSLLAQLEENTDVGMVVPKVLYPSGNWQKSFDQYPTMLHKLKRFFGLRKIEARQALNELSSQQVRAIDYAISAFWLFKRDTLENVGYLDEKIFYSPEDVDYCLRVWKVGLKIIYDPAVSIVHHTQEISRGFKLNRAKISHLKGLLYLFYKHRYFFSPPQFARTDTQQGRDLQGLKVLHVFDHSLPLHDGYSFRSLNLLREQKKRGWYPAGVTSPKHEIGLKCSCPEQEEVEGFSFYRSGSSIKSSLPVLGDLHLMHVLSRRIVEVAQLENSNVIHAHSPILNAIPALWAGRKLSLPVIYEIRAFWEDAAVDQGSCKEWGLRYRLTRALESWVCKRVDQVAILCNGLKVDLVQRGVPADKITPVFNGVNADDFQSCKPDAEYQTEWQLEGKPVIGFIGSFYRYEGLDLLIKAFVRVAKQDKEVVLLLVGGGEMESELKDLVTNLKLGDRVVMPGRVPHQRVPGVYAMIDILAYPRYSMRLTELVTPLKPMEAMAMGKVLVASDVGGHKELIIDGETGVLFKAGDEGALASVLSSLLEDQGRCKAIQEKAITWVAENQTWERTTRVYQDIYTKIL